MKEVLQYLNAHFWITNTDEYVAAAYQYATQITKKSHDTPERPFRSRCYNRLYIGRNQFLATAYVSIRPSPVKRKGKKQPSPDPDATTDYTLEEVDSLPLPLLH